VVLLGFGLFSFAQQRAIHLRQWPIVVSASPFGGFKMSGYSLELSEEGLKSYTESETVTAAL
jgi:acyl-CoA reductase-like NAD-dependent aldehyde dehydrogenase